MRILLALLLLVNTAKAIETGAADTVMRVPASGSNGRAKLGAIDLSKSAAVGASILGAANGGSGIAIFPDNAAEIDNLSIAATVSANALTISLKTKAAATASVTDPIKIGFRNATAATGTYTVVSVTGALTTVISSGSTGGQVSAQPEKTYVYALNNAGTAELAWSSSRVWDENSLQTTTAEGGAGAADDRYTLYSTTARASVPIRYLGEVLSTQTTAGTWAAAVTQISTVARRPVSFRSIVIATSPGAGAAGHGSNNSDIRRYTATQINVGTAITYADSAANGGSFTINEYGIYLWSVSDGQGTGSVYIGASINSNQLTTQIPSITAANILGYQTTTATYSNSASGFFIGLPGDVVRSHDDGAATNTAANSKFSIMKITDL